MQTTGKAPWGSGPAQHGSIGNRFCRYLEVNPSESIKRKKRGKVPGDVREAPAMWKLSEGRMSNTERKQMSGGFQEQGGPLGWRGRRRWGVWEKSLGSPHH